MSLDHVNTLGTVVDAICEIDQRTILSAVFRGSLSALGSAVQLEIRRAQAPAVVTEPAEETAEPASNGEQSHAVESRGIDTSAYEARITAVQWVIANSGGIPTPLVEKEAVTAYEWLLTRKDGDTKTVDLDDLIEIGLDKDTIEAGRKLAARWDKDRSEERTEIVKSIGGTVIRDICSQVDQHDLESQVVGLVVELLGKSVHKAMITSTARVEAASWSPRRKSEAVSELAGYVAVREMLEGMDITDVRDTISSDRVIW